MFTRARVCADSELSHVEEWLKTVLASAAGDDTQQKRVALLLRALAASHKYQLMRLRMWCEQQLCECIDVAEACNVLCQARWRERFGAGTSLTFRARRLTSLKRSSSRGHAWSSSRRTWSRWS